MTRKYEPIWDAIKSQPVGKELPVKVHGTAVRTLKQAVLKEKSIETAARKRLGMRFAGKLEIRIVTEGVTPTGYAIVYFKLSWDGTRL
jgi:hypothetical protein